MRSAAPPGKAPGVLMCCVELCNPAYQRPDNVENVSSTHSSGMGRPLPVPLRIPKRVSLTYREQRLHDAEHRLRRDLGESATQLPDEVGAPAFPSASSTPSRFSKPCCSAMARCFWLIDSGLSSRRPPDPRSGATRPSLRRKHLAGS